MKFLLAWFSPFLALCQSTGHQPEMHHIVIDDQLWGWTFTDCPTSNALGVYRNTDANFPILGNWTQKGGQTTFTAIAPLAKHHTYFLRYRDNVGVSQQLAIEDISPVPRVTPHVVRFYPSADTLPENLLRLYIEFSQPMREDNFFNHISFADENGTELSGVFLPSKYEYWNKERTKITILFDPGRVKTGLIAHDSLGRALVPGKTYTLTVLPTWPAMSGRALQTSVAKTFVVSQEEMRALEPDLWSLSKPASGSREPLHIDFNRSMDHINVQTYFVVVDQRGEEVQGDIDLQNDEKRWVFQPQKAWTRQNYQVLIHRRLEDVCGNTLVHGFDVYKATKQAKAFSKDYATIDFEVD